MKLSFALFSFVSVASGFLPRPTLTAPSRDLQVLHAEAPGNDALKVAKSVAAGLCLVASSWFLNPAQPCFAESSRIVGQIQGSGLVFKDTLQIESFDDPKVKGVTLYISNFQRPLTERLTSNFMTDPSSASVACARTGPISIADNIARGKNGEEVFEESRSLLFKTLRVQRIYDAEKNTVVYVTFNTRLDKNDDANKSRFKSSLCAINLDDYVPEKPAPAAPVAETGTPAV